MSTISKQVICVVVLFIATVLTLQAQKGDTTFRRNTIKMDITSHWLYRNAVMLSYERVLKNKPYQTWGITAGYQQFPTVFSIDNIKVKKQTEATGLKLGGEYRFYLKKENKFKAPRGVYIGPYTTFHKYSNGRSLEVDHDGLTEYAELKTDLTILNIGVQLGYQFILNNRWAIDMVFIGPSVSNYGLKAKLEGNYTFNADDITNEVIKGLIDKYPAFKDLINEGDFTTRGKTSTWAYGYRFQLQVGYHFGRKKK